MKEITLYRSKSECSACGACMSVCPKSAISMQEDVYGYKYPVINSELCIHCGKCMDICGYKKVRAISEPIIAYAAISKKEELKKRSASGGIFATLAEGFLKSGGSVAGAVLECKGGDVNVFHCMTDDLNTLYKMQGSKYVQSDAWRAYKDINVAIKSGKKVLFCGTPCQVEAIKGITGNPSNLITIDLVCHGVPPIKMLKDFFIMFGRTLGSPIKDFLFRDKSCKKQFCSRIITEKNKIFYIHSQYISYYKYFLEGVTYRENCYSCPYANRNRISDITLGDYWGIEECHKDDIKNGLINPEQSWSSVLVNTEKGNDFIKAYGEELEMVPSYTEWIARTNKQLNLPSQKSGLRERVLNIYINVGYAGVEKDYRKRNGGELRFRWRLLKEIYINKRYCM